MEGRLHGDPLADAKLSDTRTHGDDIAGRLVAEYARVAGEVGTDAPVEVPVEVGTADTDGADADGNLSGPWLGGIRDLAFLENTLGCKLDSAHTELAVYAVAGRQRGPGNQLNLKGLPLPAACGLPRQCAYPNLARRHNGKAASP
jgi:hypothetical protein